MSSGPNSTQLKINHNLYYAEGQLRVSPALKTFLADQKVLSKKDAGLDNLDDITEALWTLLHKSIDVPSYLMDTSHPLTEYFISSSHNTYLTGHQLFGDSFTDMYKSVLTAGARCVEIDAWDNEDNEEEPNVTHGYTIVSKISFRSVCETILDVVDKEHLTTPILISLENHCNAHGQLRLVQIMKSVWGTRLLSEPARKKVHQKRQGTGKNVHLQDLGSKIVLIVEYHVRKKDAPAADVIPELANLGVYQSLKYNHISWYDQTNFKNLPHHHLINISESELASFMPAENANIGVHNAQHLMRVFPVGTRISSKNLNPVSFWGVGAQVCALNWQTFDVNMQINNALFSGSGGYVLKPVALRAHGNGILSTGKKKRLRLYIVGATNVPVEESSETMDIKPYVTCRLIHPDNLTKSLSNRRTFPYIYQKNDLFDENENPLPTDPVWRQVLKWDYEDNELVFLRMLIKNYKSFIRDSVLAVATVRVMYTTSGWSFIRMLDLTGRYTKCFLLVKFKVNDV